MHTAHCTLPQWHRCYAQRLLVDLTDCSGLQGGKAEREQRLKEAVRASLQHWRSRAPSALATSDRLIRIFHMMRREELKQALLLIKLATQTVRF